MDRRKGERKINEKKKKDSSTRLGDKCQPSAIDLKKEMGENLAGGEVRVQHLKGRFGGEEKLVEATLEK